jgi:tRNA A37 methylthiotransferase MiaB
MTRKLHVKSYGCQMNAHDAERMADLLAREGWERTDRAEDADMVLLNTCHIREKAAEKVYSDIGRLKPLRAAKPDLRIAVAGCVAQAEGAEILARAPSVDLVVGAAELPEPPALLRRVEAGEKVVEPSSRRGQVRALPAALARGPTAFLTVQEGCDKFCTFCVVPYTRGRRGEPADGAGRGGGAEPRRARGSREVTLLGQNVNAWHGAEGGLAALVRELARIEGLERIRYTTSHPNDMDDALIAAHGRGAEAHALPAPAGAVGLGPRAQGHEPQAHGPGLPAARGAPARGAARPRAQLGLHHRLPGETEATSRRRWPWSRRCASPPPSPSPTRRAPARPAAERPRWTLRSPTTASCGSRR